MAEIAPNEGRDGDLMRCSAKPACYLCASRGSVLYSELTDRLFGQPGSWNLRRCINGDCGLVWLDPMPLETEIWKAYRNYYTHQDDALPNSTGGPLRGLYQFAKRAYQQYYYSPNGSSRNLVTAAASMPITMLRPLREAFDLPQRYFASGRGRMLDVGCGNGDVVRMAAERGWEAEGIDIDPAAIDNARRKGLNVRLGTLDDRPYPPGSFDLITSSHVLEHVHDPVKLLRQCRELLREGGLLVLFTPNVESLGHRRWSSAYRGLEPPRHLMLFSRRTLAEASRRAGFDRFRISSTLRANVGTELESRRVRSGRENPLGPDRDAEKLIALVHAIRAQITAWFDPLCGDELMMEAWK